MTGKRRRGRTSRAASRELYFACFGEEKVWRGARVRVASSKKKTSKIRPVFCGCEIVFQFQIHRGVRVKNFWVCIPGKMYRDGPTTRVVLMIL